VDREQIIVCCVLLVFFPCLQVAVVMTASREGQRRRKQGREGESKADPPISGTDSSGV